MSKSNRVSLPISQGGLLGGYNELLKTKIMFSPKVIIYFGILLVVFELILHNI